MRTVIFGVDGLTFRVLEPLAARGDLPNFQRLKQEGCEAVLQSKYPPLTPPAWVSLFTGLKPARHGVYDFWSYEEQLPAGSGRKAHVQTRRKGGKAIWNLLSEYGKQVLVLNVPMTYPSEVVNGLMVSGYMTPSEQVEFTYPASFKQELYRVVPDYQIDLDLNNFYILGTKLDDRPATELIDATLHMTEQRIKLMTYLLKEKPWDFCYVVFVGPDRLQHPLWKNIISLETDATEYFRLLDTAIGLILDQLDADDNLFVVSDHGFQGATCVFDINEYLYSKGLLTLNADFQQRYISASRRAHLKHTLDRVGLLSLIRRVKKSFVNAGLLKRYFAKDRPILNDNDIDWEHTLAYVPSQSGFGGGFADIFLGDMLSHERLAELCEDLKRQVHPQTGKPLVDAIYTEEVFGQGPYAPKERHLLVLPTDGVTFRMNLGNKRLWEDMIKTRGTHQKDGVLYAYGGRIKRGFKAPNAEVYDIVPTVLHSMGLPLPGPFDGRILDELFIQSDQSDQPEQQAKSLIGNGRARRALKRLQDA